MLAQNFPEIGGLQDTIKQEAPEYRISTEKFVQVLNFGRCHWAALTNDGSEVKLMDSLCSELTSDDKRLIAEILHSPLPFISVKQLNVHQQRGSSDCGLFALAFVTAVCHGIDPTSLYFDQDSMRAHLMNGFESGGADAFPVSKIHTKRKPVNEIVNKDIHCLCRLPDTGTQMVECDHCKCWYHVQC